MKNNYDKSSSGVSVELSFQHDIDISEMDFRENFKVLQYRAYQKDAVYHYIDYGQEEEITEVMDLFDFSRCNRDDLKKWCLEYIEHIDRDDLKNIDRDDKWKELFVGTFSDYYDWGDISRNKVDIPNNAVWLFNPLRLSGYCQGDCCTVLVRSSLIDKYKGGIDSISYRMERLIYDSPIDCYVGIERDGEVNHMQGVNINHYMKDVYVWDRKEILEIVEKQINETTPPYSEEDKEIVIKFMKSNLPEYI